MYVVGCIGSDNVLGRTFSCDTPDHCLCALAILLEENGHDIPDDDPFADDSVYCVGDTIYFCGLLENAE